MNEKELILFESLVKNIGEIKNTLKEFVLEVKHIKEEMHHLTSLTKKHLDILIEDGWSDSDFDQDFDPSNN